MRANFAQNEHQDLIIAGLSNTLARMQVSQKLGHNRINVTRSCVP